MVWNGDNESVKMLRGFSCEQREGRYCMGSRVDDWAQVYDTKQTFVPP